VTTDLGKAAWLNFIFSISAVKTGNIFDVETKKLQNIITTKVIRLFQELFRRNKR